MQTLEQKALKKLNKKVYDGIAAEMKEAMRVEPFLSRNAVGHKNEGDLVRLDVDQKRLQAQHNNIKQQWRQVLDSKKNDS